MKYKYLCIQVLLVTYVVLAMVEPQEAAGAHIRNSVT